MALHILNQAPGNIACLERCLKALAPNDALLLIEDGVYATLPAHAARFASLDQIDCYVLQPDLQARGIEDSVSSPFNIIDDAGFVELACEQDKVISWF